MSTIFRTAIILLVTIGQISNKKTALVLKQLKSASSKELSLGSQGAKYHLHAYVTFEES